MKKLTVAILLFGSGILWAEEITGVVVSTSLIHHVVPKDVVDLVISDKDLKTIMKIDTDGDIFLRGKWIGKDVRLVHVFDYLR